MDSTKLSREQILLKAEELKKLNEQFELHAMECDKIERYFSAMMVGRDSDSFHVAFQKDKEKLEKLRVAIDKYYNEVVGIAKNERINNCIDK